MNERYLPRPEEYPAIEVGLPLPGLRQAWELDGVKYEDQIISTAHGELHYFPVQLRDGTIMWAVEDDENTDETIFCVTVESGTGIVLSINMDE